MQRLFAFRIALIKLATVVDGDQKATFSIDTTPRCKGERYSFPGLVHFTLDPYLIMLSVKQGSIKNHFLSYIYIYIYIYNSEFHVYLSLYIYKYVCVYVHETWGYESVTQGSNYLNQLSRFDIDHFILFKNNNNGNTMFIVIYIYIYILRERERGRERESHDYYHQDPF